MKQNVRVSVSVLKKVRKQIKKTKQTVGGFYDLAAEEKLLRDEAHLNSLNSIKEKGE